MKYLRISERGAAIVAIAVLAIIVYGAFAKHDPFSRAFTVSAEFSSAAQLAPGSLVRISGLNVGKVTAIDRGPDNTALVRMEIDRPGAIHADARMTLVPRLLFEGNGAITIEPGSPSAPLIRSGATVPLSRTATSVQLDEVISTLTRPTRDALVNSVANLQHGLAPAPPGRKPAGAGSAGLRKAARELDASLPHVQRFAEAAQGTARGDAGRLVKSVGATASQAARDPDALSGIITSYNRTFRALAIEQRPLAESIVALDALEQSSPSQFARITRQLPAVTKLAAAALPALKVAPPALRAATAFVDQADAISRPSELPKLLDAAHPAIRALPGLIADATRLSARLGPVSKCLATKVVPVLNMKVPDGALSTDRPVWQDALHLGAGLAGGSPNYDGNGVTIRVGVAEGAQAAGGLLPGIGQISASIGLGGVRPTWLGYGIDPPFRPDAPCADQALADLSQRSGTAPASLRASSRPAAPAPSLLDELLTPGRRHALLQRLLPEAAKPGAPSKPTTSSKPGAPPKPAEKPKLPLLGSPPPSGGAKPSPGSQDGGNVNPIKGLLDKLLGGGPKR
jgi:phospholipid/cholesterol/gamma-HCH transport system substrate-binding protein